jgi:hypothetical protein
MPRDEFSRKLRDTLSKRVSLRCSNPICRDPTTGPHSISDSFVDVGVAGHITAAALGGPRYDAALTVQERTSIDNAIWLCQRCAKLVDDDVSRYPAGLLRRWKVNAEAEALRAVAGTLQPEFFPQPVSANHTPIPRIAGLRYGEARNFLIDAGWQPWRHHWSYGSQPDLQYGNGKIYWERGFWEIIHASGTGLSHCLFEFRDVYGNRLMINTAGELDEDSGSDVPVWNWFFDSSPGL